MALVMFNLTDVDQIDINDMINRVGNIINLKLEPKKLFKGKILGYYNTETKTVHIPNTVLNPKTTEEARKNLAVLAHEFTHAILDKFGFVDKMTSHISGSDVELVKHFLHELLAYMVSTMLQCEMRDSKFKKEEQYKSIFSKALYAAAYDMEGRYPKRMGFIEDWYNFYYAPQFDCDLNDMFDLVKCIFGAMGIEVVESKIYL